MKTFKYFLEQAPDQEPSTDATEKENSISNQLKSKENRQKMIKKQVLLKKMQAVRAGAGADIVASHTPDGELVEGDVHSGQGEKIQKRTKKWMEKKGQKGAPGLDAMKARTADHKAKRGVKEEVVDEAMYTGPKKGDLKGYGSKAFKEYEKNMDPKKRQALKDKATKGMKFTHEGMSYGLYKGSGKAGGAMKAYLDKKAEMLKKKRNKQSDAAKNNPHFDSTQPSPSGRNKYEQVTFQQFQEKCWPGYEKKGMKTMFGKRYPNCVKKKK